MEAKVGGGAAPAASAEPAASGETALSIIPIEQNQCAIFSIFAMPSVPKSVGPTLSFPPEFDAAAKAFDEATREMGKKCIKAVYTIACLWNTFIGHVALHT